MDIISGLSAAKMALDLAKDLREIDKSVDEAAFKMKLAELMSALADAQVAMSDAKLEISELRTRLDTREKGSNCPICLNGHLRVVNLRPDSAWPDYEKHFIECTAADCDYSVDRTFDKQRMIYLGSEKS